QLVHHLVGEMARSVGQETDPVQRELLLYGLDRCVKEMMRRNGMMPIPGPVFTAPSDSNLQAEPAESTEHHQSGEEETSSTSVESEPEKDITSDNDLDATIVQQPTSANEDDDGDALSTNEGRQAIAGLGSLSLDDRLGKMSLALSNSVSKEALTDARDGLFTELLSRKIKVKTNNKEELKGFEG
ncbi:hypothetical protein LTR60_004251, partial [Cryomyces antarcticus]